MATLETLVATIARVEGLGPERVRAIARVMREAGLIASGGRGPSAAKMTERDAANLLIAVNVADTARGVPELVKRYRRLRPSSGTWRANFGRELDKLLSAICRRKTADCVANLVRLASTPPPLGSERYDARELELLIWFFAPVPEVVVKVRERSGAKTYAIEFFRSAEKSSGAASDRYHIIAITERTLFAVGRALRE